MIVRAWQIAKLFKIIFISQMNDTLTIEDVRDMINSDPEIMECKQTLVELRKHLAVQSAYLTKLQQEKDDRKRRAAYCKIPFIKLRDDLETFKVKRLTSLCDMFNLPQTGLKADKFNRVKNHLDEMIDGRYCKSCGINRTLERVCLDCYDKSTNN